MSIFFLLDFQTGCLSYTPENQCFIYKLLLHTLPHTTFLMLFQSSLVKTVLTLEFHFKFVLESSALVRSSLFKAQSLGSRQAGLFILLLLSIVPQPVSGAWLIDGFLVKSLAVTFLWVTIQLQTVTEGTRDWASAEVKG